MDKAQQTDIKSIFQEAAESVKDLPQNLQEKAFELAVLRLSSPAKITGDENKQSIPVTTTTHLDFFSKLAQELNISKDSLKVIYKVDKNGVLKIVAPLAGKTAEKQRMIAYLYLLGIRFGFGKEWVSALEFAERVNEYGANDGHISKSLKKEKHNILQDGKMRGKEYSLTPNGISKAKEIISDMLNK